MNEAAKIVRNTTPFVVTDLVKHAKHAPLLILLIGTPGSGKSTFAEELGKYMQFTTVNTDNSVNDARVIETRWNYFKRKYAEALAYSHHVVVDQTNMHHAVRRWRLNQSNAHLRVAVDLNTVPKEVLYKRVKEREYRTGRPMPRHVIDDLAAQYEPPSFTDGFDLIYFVHDEERKDEGDL